MSSNAAAFEAASLAARFASRLAAGQRGLSTPGTAYALQVLKTVVAAQVALLLSLAWDLGSPRTAVVAVFLVMLQQTGLVFQKSFYRLLGTCVGAVVSLALVGAFAQERELFAIGFALWIALCTAGSFFYRNFKSYGFVLSGYTLGFIALPTIDLPAQVFDVAVNRVLEMALGVACATLVSDVLFPQRITDSIRQALERRLQHLLAVLHEAPAKVLEPQAMGKAMLRFIGDAIGLETARVNAAMESSPLRRQRQRLLQLNNDYMQLSTTVHSLHRHLRRMHDFGSRRAYDAVLALYRSLAKALVLVPGEEAIVQNRRALAAWSELLAYGRTPLLDPGNAEATDEERLDYATGRELLERLAEELKIYFAIHLAYQHNAELPAAEQTDKVAEAQTLRYSLRSDPWLTAVAALRGFAVAIFSFWLWFAGDWGMGAFAIANAIPNSTLFAASPTPTLAVKQFMQGCLLALLLGLIWNFGLLPLATDWLWLCIALTPVFALAAWLGNNPRTIGIGAGLYVCFLLHGSFDRSYAAVLSEFIEAHLADLAGCAVSLAFYWIIDPNIGAWRHKRMVRTLRAQVVEICRSPAPLSPAWLESSSRDLVQSITTRGQLADDSDRWVFLWLLAVLEVGRSLIEFRREFSALADRTVNPDLLALRERTQEPVLAQVAHLFDVPTEAALESALGAVSRAIGELSASLGSPDFPQATVQQRRQLRIDLHFIRSALMEQRGLLSAA